MKFTYKDRQNLGFSSESNEYVNLEAVYSIVLSGLVKMV